MSYALYQVQMANAWKQRIEKENATAEKFWTEQALGSTSPSKMHTTQSVGQWDSGSVAGSKASSAAPSGYTSKTSFLRSRLDKLEMELGVEREQRKQVETDLETLRNSQQFSTGSKPGTPRHA